MPNQVKLKLEFYNQDAENIEDCMKQIAEDTTIVAIVANDFRPCHFDGSETECKERL